MNKIVLTYIWVLMIIGSGQACASGLDSRFEQDLKKYVHSVDQAFYGFHYISASGLGLTAGHLADEINDPRIQNHVRLWSDDYSKPKSMAVGEQIQAFFMALDPSASRGYGGDGDDWLLYRVKIPSGLKYIDISSRPLIPVEVQAELLSSGCNPSNLSVLPSEFNYNALLQWSNGPECSARVISALREMGIGAIAYEYDAMSGIEGCSNYGEPSFRQLAFILIDRNEIEKTDVQIFWKGTLDESPEGVEKNYIAQIGGDLWTAKDKAPDGFDEWKKNNLLNCQSKKTKH